MNTNLILIACILITLQKQVAGSCKGCVELDTLTFDKVVENFKYSIIKFDVPYPYGPKHEEFETFAKDIADNKDLLVGEVGVKDYGEKDNQDVADRYGIDVKDLPKILLFNRDNIKKPVIFSEEQYTADAYRLFVRQNTKLYLGLPGCILEFDELAAKFISAAEEEQKQILHDAAKLVIAYHSKAEEEDATAYVQFMTRVAERGSTFVAAEKQRLKKILSGKITDAKKNSLKRRLNVLESFTSTEQKGIKTEL